MTLPIKKSHVHFFSLLLISIPVLLSCTKTSSEPAQNVIPVTIDADTTRVDSLQRRYLALGDSYTIGQSVPVNERYPVQAVQLMRKAGYNMADADIVATSGWTTTDLLEAIKNKPATPEFDLVTLLIGVNNQYQGGTIPNYRTEFKALLEQSIRFAGDRADHVIVLSIPDYSVTPFATNADREKIAHEIDSFNFVNKQISGQYHVSYLDVTGESRRAAGDKSLIAYDGLHFSGKEYTIWSNALLPLMKAAVK